MRWRGTTLVSAFALQSIVASFTTLVAYTMYQALPTNIPQVFKVILNAVITMLTTFSILILMHAFFGYGAALVDDSTHTRRAEIGSWHRD